MKMTTVSRQHTRNKKLVVAYLKKKGVALVKNCSLCKGDLEANGSIYGHNPQPYKNLKVSQSVCNSCHDKFVVPARVNAILHSIIARHEKPTEVSIETLKQKGAKTCK
jgi:hypothetical protein